MAAYAVVTLDTTPGLIKLSRLPEFRALLTQEKERWDDPGAECPGDYCCSAPE